MKNAVMKELTEELTLSAVQPGKKERRFMRHLVCSIRYSVVQITSSLLNITLESSVRTTLVCKGEIIKSHSRRRNWVRMYFFSHKGLLSITYCNYRSMKHWSMAHFQSSLIERWKISLLVNLFQKLLANKTVRSSDVNSLFTSVFGSILYFAYTTS